MFTPEQREQVIKLLGYFFDGGADNSSFVEEVSELVAQIEAVAYPDDGPLLRGEAPVSDGSLPKDYY